MAHFEAKYHTSERTKTRFEISKTFINPLKVTNIHIVATKNSHKHIFGTFNKMLEIFQKLDPKCYTYLESSGFRRVRNSDLVKLKSSLFLKLFNMGVYKMGNQKRISQSQHNKFFLVGKKPEFT